MHAAGSVFSILSRLVDGLLIRRPQWKTGMSGWWIRHVFTYFISKMTLSTVIGDKTLELENQLIFFIDRSLFSMFRRVERFCSPGSHLPPGEATSFRGLPPWTNEPSTIRDRIPSPGRTGQQDNYSL